MKICIYLILVVVFCGIVSGHQDTQTEECKAVKLYSQSYKNTRISGAVKLPLHSSADTGKHDMYDMSNCYIGEGSVDKME